MAPIKFDDTIKDKLEKRSLQPSANAWDTLSKRLDVHDKKNSKRLVLYIGIAASIVGVLLVTTLFFKASEDQTISTKIVDTKIKDSQEKIQPLKHSTTQEAVVSISKDENIQKEDKVKDFELQRNITTKNEPKVTQILDTHRASTTKEKHMPYDLKKEAVVALIDTNTSIKKEAVAFDYLTQEELKVIDVVNQIKALNSDGTAVTEQEINDLLKKAEQEILRDRIYNETTRSVDANALLQDVEADLEQSFRTKVFEALKSSYKTVKTAVAERNN